MQGHLYRPILTLVVHREGFWRLKYARPAERNSKKCCCHAKLINKENNGSSITITSVPLIITYGWIYELNTCIRIEPRQSKPGSKIGTSEANSQLSSSKTLPRKSLSYKKRTRNITSNTIREKTEEETTWPLITYANQLSLINYIRGSSLFSPLLTVHLRTDSVMLIILIIYCPYWRQIPLSSGITFFCFISFLLYFHWHGHFYMISIVLYILQ